MSATHKVDQVHWSSGFLVPPPRHVLVGTHEHQLVRIDCPPIGGVGVEDGKWDAALRGGFDNTTDIFSRIETNECVVRSERIVERAAVAQPQVGCPATGNRR